MSQQRMEELRKKYANKYNAGSDVDRMRTHSAHRPTNHMPIAKPKDTSKTIKRLVQYIAKEKIKLIFVFFCVVLNTIATLVATYMLRPIINNLIAGKGLGVLVQGVTVMLLIYCTGILCQYLQQRIMMEVSQKVLATLRKDLYNHVVKLPLGYFDSNSYGDVMSRFTNDVDIVGEMVTSTVVQLISGSILIVGTIVLMVKTNILLSAVTFIMIPSIIYFGRFISKKSRKYYKDKQSSLGILNGYVEEMVTGQKVIKVYSNEEMIKEEFAFLNNDLREKLVRANFFGSITGPVIGNLSQINYALTTCLGAILCVTRGFDIGGLTIFVGYARQFSRPINEISMQINTVFSAVAGAERIFEVMDKEPEDGEANENKAINKIEGKIEFKKVVFGYNKEKTVLKDISFTVEKGQKVAFVGSTGAGKTTITNLINRFYEIESGEILIDGISIYDMSKNQLRRNIATVLQDTHLFNGTIMENIRYGRLDVTDEEVIKAAKTASAHSFITRLEKAYETVITGDGGSLSQGQRQLLNIARAAISNAPILVLDEATSSVDTRTEKLIERGMDKIMENRTTLIIAHRLSTVRNSDNIIVLENGKIIESGNHEELLKMKNRYHQLYTGAIELD